MTEVKVAVPGASGWMGKTHTMAYQSLVYGDAPPPVTDKTEWDDVTNPDGANIPMWPTFENGHHICQFVEAYMVSSNKPTWFKIT